MSSHSLSKYHANPLIPSNSYEITNLNQKGKKHGCFPTVFLKIHGFPLVSGKDLHQASEEEFQDDWDEARKPLKAVYKQINLNIYD